MKTKYLLGAAIVAALNCATLNAQVIGGNAVGGLGGSLGGGLGSMREVTVVGQGSGHGAFGADTSPLRRTTSDASSRASNRTRDTLDTTRTRARSTVGATTHTARAAVDAGTSAAFDATRQVNSTARQIDATASTATAAASSVDVDGAALGAASDAAHEQQLAARLMKPAVHHDALGSIAKDARTEAPQLPAAQPSDAKPGLMPSPSVEGALSKQVDASAQSNGAMLPVKASTDAQTQGSASASRERGLSANGNAEGGASASLKK